MTPDNRSASERRFGSAEWPTPGGMLRTFVLLKADPHRHGAGKTHALDDDTDDAKTRCGKQRSQCPGRVYEGDIDDVDCKGCLNGFDADRRREEQTRQWERRQAERQAERKQQNREWWARYNTYLASPEWRRRRALVLKRAQGVCEGCGSRNASQVHHMTYVRVGDEMLFDPVAVCDDCHRRIHAGRQAA